MKTIPGILFISFFLLSFSSFKTGASAGFAGSWKGSEQCQGVSAPVSIVVITTDGPDQVFLTGLYSMEGKVRGIVKGNTINIPRQAVVDPKFKNMMIEGSLTISKDHATLIGIFAIMNNNLRDNCTASYHK